MITIKIRNAPINSFECKNLFDNNLSKKKGKRYKMDNRKRKRTDKTRQNKPTEDKKQRTKFNIENKKPEVISFHLEGSRSCSISSIRRAAHIRSNLVISLIRYKKL